jgi:hypothetical protein
MMIWVMNKPKKRIGFDSDSELIANGEEETPRGQAKDTLGCPCQGQKWCNEIVEAIVVKFYIFAG